MRFRRWHYSRQRMPPLDSQDLKYTKVLSGQEALGALHPATNEGSVLKMCLLQNSSFVSASFSRCPAHGEEGCKHKIILPP